MQHKFKSALTSIIFVFCVLLFANNAVADLPLCPPAWESDGTPVYLPNPEMSRLYYECDNGNPVSICCPVNLHFCSEKSTCTWDWDAECAFTDTVIYDDDSEEVRGLVSACGWDVLPDPSPTCSCKTGTTTTETIDIYGGIKKTITTDKYCGGTGCGSSCYDTCHDTVSYSCECNSGYTVNNQGAACNCIQCPAGSYVGGTLASPTCVTCPKNDDVAQTVGTSAANNTSTSPTSCYLPKDTTYTDTTGGYSFTTQCDYGL